MKTFGGFIVGLAALALPSLSTAQPRLEIDTAADRGAVSRDVYGGDLEFINSNVPEVAALAAELPLLRFPGGDADATFRWDQSLPPRCTRQGFDWNAAATVASRGRSGLFLETNILRSTPANAAAWVQDATRRGLRVAWVGIGNEVWGDWDAGYRSASRYASDVIAHATAIRALVPGTRIVLSIGTAREDAWNREAIRRTAAVIDAVDYHYYPNHHAWTDMRPEQVVAGAEGIAPLLARLRAMIRAEAGARASAIQVVLGEWDGAADAPRVMKMDQLVTPRAYAMWSMADALFYGAALGEMHTGGVAAAMFYEVQGFRFGAIPGDWCVDQDTSIRRPKALVHQLWREHFGDRLVAVTAAGVPSYRVSGPTNWDGFAGDVPYVRAYASLADSGRSLRMIVTNRGGASNVASIAITLRSFAPESTASVWEVGGGGVMDTNENVRGPIDVVRIRARSMAVAGAAFTLPLAPYSVMAIELRRSGGPVVMDAGTDAGPAVDVPVVGRDVPRPEVDVPVVGRDVPRPEVDVPAVEVDVPVVAVDAPAPGRDAVVIGVDVPPASSDAGPTEVPQPVSQGCGCAVPGSPAPMDQMRWFLVVSLLVVMAALRPGRARGRSSR
ncbi:MAG: hypothetical protein KA978_07570 [Deltaproteobacteria bacterium]|jgi:alpha-L-arabinofuranosidase|nr:hypothetical protein [Deltaproteobacteria bacterium]